MTLKSYVLKISNRGIITCSHNDWVWYYRIEEDDFTDIQFHFYKYLLHDLFFDCLFVYVKKGDTSNATTRECIT